MGDSIHRQGSFYPLVNGREEKRFIFTQEQEDKIIKKIWREETHHMTLPNTHSVLLSN